MPLFLVRLLSSVQSSMEKKPVSKNQPESFELDMGWWFGTELEPLSKLD